MHTQKTRIARAVGTLFLPAALSACLGGGGGSSSSSNGLSGSASGIAASGLAIANATVTAKGANGTTKTTSTDANGAFTLALDGLTAPVLLKVSSGSNTYYSLLQAGETRANITPHTHALLLAALAASDSSALDSRYNSGDFASFSSSAISTAEASYRQMLEGEIGSVTGITDSSPRSIQFTPASSSQRGDEVDRLLATLKLAPSGNSLKAYNRLPEFATDATVNSYDGSSDDLLTAGLGKTGLGPTSTAPGYADAANPTASELRKNAIWNNYRAVLDINVNSGYGTLYGPNIDKNGNDTGSEGKVAGKEYITYADDGTGKKNVTLLVQIPANFDKDKPCIVTATSSGSRGIYGAVGSAGEWGLRNACAVSYTDKGSGNGLHSLDDDMVNLRTGVRASRSSAGKQSIFTADLSDAARSSYAAAFPNRSAFKHAHSQQNPEQDWGQNTLDAVSFAFYALNEEYGSKSNGNTSRAFTPKNTTVIASSISNGGGSALLAAEKDALGLIDGVAVSEPQIQPATSTSYTVQQNGAAVSNQGKALYDYATFAALYQPCISATATGTSAANRCTSLVAKGLLSGSDLAAQKADALSRMKAYGWLAESDALQGAHAGTNVLVAATYTYAYGRFSASDNVCGFSFAASDASGAPIALTAAQKAQSFAGQNGIIGSVIYENSVGGAKAYAFGTSPSTQLADQSLDGFLCLRSLATGVDAVTGAALTGTLASQSERVRAGIAAIRATGNLRGKPTVIVHGRSDTLVPVNHASRAYLALNATVEGSTSKARLIEVTNANHFDSFANALPSLIVPLHVYLFRALDAVSANLKSGTALPPSQVVRTTPRNANTTAITNANLPAIAAAPTNTDAISVSGKTVNVPN